jgi:hypothetical protein
VARDARVAQELEQLGWKVAIVWEFEMEDELARAERLPAFQGDVIGRVQGDIDPSKTLSSKIPMLSFRQSGFLARPPVNGRLRVDRLRWITR